MSNNTIGTIIFIVILFFGGLIGSSILTNFVEPHTEIIKHGCAEYNQITGKFQWKNDINE